MLAKLLLHAEERSALQRPHQKQVLFAELLSFDPFRATPSLHCCISCLTDYKISHRVCGVGFPLSLRKKWRCHFMHANTATVGGFFPTPPSQDFISKPSCHSSNKTNLYGRCRRQTNDLTAAFPDLRWHAPLIQIAAKQTITESNK